MSVIALIPARVGWKGIPGKLFRLVGGLPLVVRAVLVGLAVTPRVVVSSDADPSIIPGVYQAIKRWIQRPADLAHDDTPMIAVVQHALEALSGEPDDIIVLLQPTQPLRTPAHVEEAIRLLRETQADSVVSV